MAVTPAEAAESDAVSEPPIRRGSPRRRGYPRKDDIVLEAAEKCFVEFGYASTSMDAVAERAGVSKRTVYSNFKSKESLFAAVVQKGCGEVLPNAFDGIDIHTSTPATALTQLAERFLADIYSKPRVQMYQTVVAASRRFPAIGAMMFENSVLRSQQVFDRFFRGQAEIGNLAFPDIDLAAAQFVALLKTDLHVQLLFSQPASISKRAIKRSVAASVQLFLNGTLRR